MRNLIWLDRQRGTGIESCIKLLIYLMVERVTILRTRYGALGGLQRYGTHNSTAAMKYILFFSDIEARRLSALVEDPNSSLNRGGNSLGSTYDTLYPLTRICPVYLSSRAFVLMPLLGDDIRLEEAADGPVGVGRLLKSVRYDFDERAGRLRARAALCRSGQEVEEKL